MAKYTLGALRPAEEAGGRNLFIDKLTPVPAPSVQDYSQVRDSPLCKTEIVIFHICSGKIVLNVCGISLRL